MDGFTLLPFALCAQMIIALGQDIVDLGQVVAGKCDPFVRLGDSQGQTAPIHGHEIGVSVFDYWAEVFIDGRMFIVPKTAGI